MYQKTIADNGLRIVTSSIPNIYSVSISIFVGAGSRYEPAEQAGISHFVEHLLFKGTKQRATTKEISEAIEGIGGVLNGGTDKELTVYWTKVARPHFRVGLDVLADMIRGSKFDPVEVEKERQVIIEEINMSMDSPQQRVNMLIDEVVWRDQALGREVAGSKEIVSTFTPQALRGYWGSQYIPGNTVVSVAGDISHDEAVAYIGDLFDDWAGDTPTAWIPVRDEQDEPRLLMEFRETEQAHLCLALRGVSNSDPDRFAFDLLNIVLGEGMSSRLFLELRERRGLAYDVHSYGSHFFDSGSLTIYAGVEPKNIEAAIMVILDELSRFKAEDVPEQELVKAREMGKGRLMLRMEDTRSVSGWMGSQELLTGEIKTVDEVVSIVDAITRDDIRRVAQRLFHFGGLSLAIVGPVSDDGRFQKLLT
ncbi:MAG TPA: insulinase family protein, partial [Dehalococcoidia bacterium]|nr:insulinase family protein [Dehalococcoidia bacterium]